MKQQLLKNVSPFFNNMYHFNAINILFPHFWQLKPSPRDKNYKSKLKDKTLIRVKLLKIVIDFVIKTKRFDGNYGI